MAAVLKLLYKYYYELIESYADPRTENLFLSQNPLIPAAISFLYIKFVTKWGPQYMKNRSAFNLKIIMIVYDLVQVILASRMFYLGFKHTYILGPYKFQCEPIDFSNNWLGVLAAKEVHNYYLVKILDLLDTVFFVFRKNQRQVTFLHLYHHMGMVMASWIAVRFIPGGHIIFIGFINSFVHMVMYSYYLLSVFNNTSYIWWKKYITILQIFQFGIIAIQWGLLIVGPSCGFPKLWSLLLLPQNVFITLMFMDFYYKEYVKNKK